MLDRRRLSFALGAVVVLAGIIIPASSLLDMLGRSGSAPADLLHQGAVLLKAGIVVLGVFIAVLGAVPLEPTYTSHKVQPVETAPRYVRLMMATILIGCTILCFHRLSDGLWFDEIVTMVHYARLPFGQIVTTYDDPNQHILYSLLAHGAFVILGESNWALRLPAALFGIGSVWALFMVGRLVTSTREALLSSALLAFSYELVWFSQNARGYTGLLFLTLLSSWLFLRGLRQARPHLWLGYAVTVAMGMYIHLTMLFVVIGHFIQYAVACYSHRETAWPQRWTVLLYGFGLGAVLTFLSYSLVLPQVLATFGSAKHIPEVWMRPSWSILEFARGLRLSLFGGGVALAALLVFGAGLFSFMRTDIDLVELMVLPSILCAAVKVGTGQHLWPRSIFFAIGFMALVVTRGTTVIGAAIYPAIYPKIAQAFRVERRRESGLGTALWSLIFLASALSVPRAYGPKQDFAGAWAFVEAHKEPGDAVITIGLAAIPYRVQYHSDAEEIKSVEALDAVRSRARRIWLLYTLKFQLADLAPELQRDIERDFVVEKKFPGTLGDGTIFVCRSTIVSH